MSGRATFFWSTPKGGRTDLGKETDLTGRLEQSLDVSCDALASTRNVRPSVCELERFPYCFFFIISPPRPTSISCPYTHTFTAPTYRHLDLQAHHHVGQRRCCELFESRFSQIDRSRGRSFNLPRAYLLVANAI
jgi:hypothetical protein